MKQKITPAIIILLAVFLFASCHNIVVRQAEQPEQSTPSNAKFGIVTVPISLSENIASVSRSALPAGFSDAGGTLFFASAIVASGEPEVGGLKASEYKFSGSTSTLDIPFESSATARENYDLHIYAFPSSIKKIGDITNLSSALLHGSIKVTIGADALSFTISNKIVLLPYSESTATGSVNLVINIPDDYSLTTICSDTNFNELSFFTPASGVCTLEKDDIPKGSYSVTFLLQKGSGSNKQTVFTRKEVINVYPGMVTDKWISGGTASGSLSITTADIESTYYVRGETASGQTSWFEIFGSEDGDDTTGNGSIAKPFATVQKAIDRINAINDGESEYKIYVDGTVTAENGKATALIESNDATKKLKISIIGLGTDLNPTTLKGTGNRVIYVYGTGTLVDLKLEKLKITGGNITGRGGGIGFESNAGSSVYISNCEISGNAAAGYGGGIYSKNIVLTIENSVIKNNHSTGSAGAGGGIYISGSDSTVKLLGTTTIGSNTVTDESKKGLGIFNSLGTLELSGSVQVEDDNNIYLTSNSLITIAGDLSKTVVAKINLASASYTADTVVLKAATTAASGTALTEAQQTALIADNYEKFILNAKDDITKVCADFKIEPDTTTPTQAILVTPSLPGGITVTGPTGYSFTLSQATATRADVSVGTLELSFTASANIGDLPSGASYKIELLQNGSAIVSANSNKLTVPSWLPVGNYEVYMNIVVNDIQLDCATTAFTVTAE